jgi:hypothetical protein
MFKYPAYVAGPSEEPIIPHISQRFQPREVELESEVRYLGNMYNYCGYFNKALVDCVEGEVGKTNKKIFKECKTRLENLHNCYSLREPSEFQYENRFITENEECAYERDTFLKCYFRQATEWTYCHSHWLDIYRCRFRKDPSKFNFY